ncbi:MAG: CARDB domain-containing protein, partial [Steroidobacteraceae bacterium]
MRKEHLVLLSRRGAAVTVAVAGAAAVALGVAASLAAAAARGPDLVLASTSPAPSVQLAPGARFSERFAEKNVGSGRAGASTTGFYLSTAATFGRSATLLAPGVPIGALSPGQKIKRSAKLVIPVTVRPGAYYLIGCADIAHKVAELSESNNCRTASRRVRVACRATNSPALTSPNKYCFDGDAADGIFVSPAGKDSNPGTMAAPKQTLAAGVAAAAAQGKDVYLADGTYSEILNVANGVSVFGGYDAHWHRSPANTTTITGVTTGPPVFSFETEAALAVGVTTPTTLQLLRLAPLMPYFLGMSSYGLQGSGSTGLLLDHDTVLAQPGRPGPDGVNGTPGTPGGNGAPGSAGGVGGTSAVGHVGGQGGDPADDSGCPNCDPSQDGGAGQSTTAD